MSTRPSLALIIGSTRPQRFADKPADWLIDYAAKRDDFTLDRLDLRDFDLPFFAEAGSNLHVPSADPKVVAWQDAIRPYDGYVFVVAEYNHSITGALKNALDQAYVEWVRKPFSALGYGSTGGARAVEHLRGIGVELQMVPSKFGAHIGGSDLFKVHPFGGDAPIADIENILLPSVDAMFDDLVWWSTALREARAAV
ncbi:NADPH-dependent FMN reductase [Amycolatopsis pithecellobii]|uniref:FMN reductase n=1 Tax=Amycolatopsis pithecellobii TaxID=664692 RepID=A0A6N7Z2P5_9PSEU|nr:NADPH-dependent FMN reductase [Amycolatopsis pithecellobii]MTD53006.1 FMN reductase [Amycolatopsis pithecellobii]